MTFNPSNPLSLGAEWFPLLYGQDQLFSATDNASFVIDSAITETIAELYVPHYWAAGSGYGRLWADIYNLADLGEAQAEQSITFYPNEDKATSSVSGLGSSSGGTANLYSYVDDASNDADYMYWIGGGSRSVNWQFDTSTMPAGSRPLYVYFHLRRTYTAPVGPGLFATPSDVNLRWFDGATDKGLLGTFPAIVGGTAIYTHTLGPFYVDPKADEPWGRKTIIDLDDNTLDNVQISGTSYSGQITGFSMEVYYEATDKRVAAGGAALVTSPTGVIQTTSAMALKNPVTDVANWSKASGTDYLVVLRRLDGPLTTSGTTLKPSIPYLDSGVANPHGQGSSRAVTLSGTNGALLSVSGIALTKAYPYNLKTSATPTGAFSLDAQPYHTLTPEPANIFFSPIQTINGATATSPYRKVRMLIAVTTASPPTVDLTVKVKRLSDGLQFGGNGTVSLATLQATTPVLIKDGYTFYDYTVTLASGATLAASTVYYVEFSSTTAQNEDWWIMMLNADDISSVVGSALLGTGSTYASAPDSVAISFTGDMEIRVLIAPDDWTPTGTQTIVSKWGTAGNRSYVLELLATGILRFRWSADGTTILTADSTVAPTVTNGQPLFVSVLIDVVNGANKTVTFSTAAYTAGIPSYATLGTAVTTAGNTSIFNSTSLLNIGANSGVADFLGRIYQVILRNSASAIVFNADFRLNGGAPNFFDSGGAAVVTMQGGARIYSFDDATYANFEGHVSISSTLLEGDFAMTLASVPTTISGVTATALSAALPDMGDTNCCDDCERCYLRVSWTLTVVGVGFSYNEVQRSDDNVTWETIGKVTVEATNYFNDDEALRGALQYYRVRSVRTDGIVGDWSASASAMCPIGDGDVVYLTSNEDPTLSTGYVRLNPDHEYTFLSAEEVKLVRMHDRNFQVRFKPLEDRGVSFPLPLLIFNGSAAQPPSGAGVRGFEDILELVEDDVISYVCVLTADGERFFGSLILPTGSRKQPFNNYVANCVFVQTTATSSSPSRSA